MQTLNYELSDTRLNWLREQGFFTQTSEELRDLAFGIRFAPRLCALIVITGVFFANIPLLTFMLVVAFFGVVSPRHPFDYIYNGFIAKEINKPVLPKRSVQLKFACSLATVILSLTIYYFQAGNFTAGYITGSVIITAASLVSSIDLCIPSKIFNFIFSIKTNS